MQLDAAQGYPTASRWLHWISALMVIALIPIAITMERIDDGPPKNILFELHKSFGILVFLFAALRVCVRILLGAPKPYPALTPFERIASTATHHLLYVLLILMPVLGYIGTSMCCAPIGLFWTIPVPLEFHGTEATAEAILTAHVYAGWLMTALICLHIAGALYHYAIRRDGVLARMSLLGR